MRLLQSGFPKMELRFDFSGIDHALRIVHDQRTRAEQIDFFLLHGGTNSLIQQLFRISAAEVKARRKTLLGASKQRRPHLPKPSTRDAIHAAWWQRRKGRARTPPTIDDFLQLHAQFTECNFATLYAVVNEFED